MKLNECIAITKAFSVKRLYETKKELIAIGFSREATLLKQVTAYELYQFPNFLADIGGYLGLLLGASLVSLTEGAWEII